jgi:hypothetical protein
MARFYALIVVEAETDDRSEVIAALRDHAVIDLSNENEEHPIVALELLPHSVQKDPNYGETPVVYWP